jgi:hypothetical protein
MQRLNGYAFYQIGFYMKPLENIGEGIKLRDIYYPIWSAKTWLSWFLSGTVIPISFSKESGEKLVQVLERFAPGQNAVMPKEKAEQVFSAIDVFMITSGLREFQTVLQTELSKLDTYFISPKGIFSTSELIERADSIIPTEILNTISDSVRSDLKQAGRCLAFDLATAAGFHIMRALEGIIKDIYCPAFLGKKPTGNGWNSYIKCLEKTVADPKVLSILDQIRSLHRNPTIHPQVVLTINESLSLFGIAQSAIVAMMEDVKKQKPVNLIGVPAKAV